MRNILLILNRQIIMLPEPINVLTIQFANEISQQEIPLFRGAVIHSLENKSILFHNHEGDKFRYSYPLIQYKRIRGKAAIVCLKQGTEDIGELFSAKLKPFSLGTRVITPSIDKILPRRIRIQIWNNLFSYRINRWIPLNSKNYKEYSQLTDDSEKAQFLSKILTGNILSMAKGLGIIFEKEVKCEVTTFTESTIVKVKSIAMQCIDAEFKCNVSIPNYIGLGKHASINYGVVTKMRINNNEE